MELFKANDQWMTRPADQRFWTLKDMHAAVEGYRATAREAVVRQGDMKFVATKDGSVALQGKHGQTAMLTHWAFDQVAQQLSAPAWYLRTLSPELTADNLNFCLKDDENDDRSAVLLLHGTNGGTVARAFTSEAYGRIWNADVVQRLLALPKGWRVPPARPAQPGQAGTRKATKADLVFSGSSGLAVNVGDDIAPAGLYASDHDMFAFMVNEENRIKDGSKDGLARGFFCWNSEVGAGAFYLMAFMYKFVCGNHIVWGAENVTKIRVVHRADDEARIRAARRLKLGDSKDKVLDAIFKFGIAGLPKKTLSDAYDTAEVHRADYGDPRTLWSMVNGITHYSQETAFADERTTLDRAAGRLLQVAF